MARVKRTSGGLADGKAAGGLPEPDDLSVLLPDVPIEIIGADGKAETVTVREFSFMEQTRYGKELARLAEIFRPRPDISEGEAVNFLLDAIADAPDEIAVVVSASVDRTPEWFNGLSGEAGEAVVLAWWGINKGFFLRRLARSLLAAIRRGAVSSQP